METPPSWLTGKLLYSTRRRYVRIVTRTYPSRVTYIPLFTYGPRGARSDPKRNECHVINAEEEARSDPVAPGYLAGTSEYAFVDSCAENFVSSRYLQKRGIQMTSESRRLIFRADGSSFSTLGIVRLPWRFKGESKKYMIEFYVLESNYCDHAVTLGGEFLKSTRTLTSFIKSRVIRKLRDAHGPRVRFQGGGQLRLRRLCNGRKVDALPDTGSDYRLMSPQLAHELELKIDSAEKHRVVVELPGKHYVRTQGVVRNVLWQFGTFPLFAERHTLDLYVLDGLLCDVLLDCDFLLDTNAVEMHTDSLIEPRCDESGNADDLFCNVKRVKKRRGLLERLKTRLQGATQPHAQNPVASIDTAINLLDQAQAIHESDKTDQEKEADIELVKQQWRRLDLHPSCARPSNGSAMQGGRLHSPTPGQSSLPQCTSPQANIDGHNAAG